MVEKNLVTRLFPLIRFMLMCILCLFIVRRIDLGFSMAKDEKTKGRIEMHHRRNHLPAHFLVGGDCETHGNECLAFFTSDSEMFRSAKTNILRTLSVTPILLWITGKDFCSLFAL